MPSASKINIAKVRVLVVALAATSILSVLIYLLSGGTIFTPKATVHTFLTDGTGLGKGSPVQINGIPVGKVSAVSLGGSDPKRPVRVDLTVETEFLRQIPEDSTTAVSTSTLLGDKYIDINPGKSPAAVRPGGELAFQPPSDFMKNLDISQFEARLKTIEATLSDLEEGRTPLGQFVKTDDAYRSILRRVSDLQRGFRNATNTTTALGQLVYTDAALDRIGKPLRELDQKLADLQAKKLLRDPQLYDKIHSEIADLGRTLEKLHSNNFLARDTAYEGWNRMLARLITKVDEFNTHPWLTSSATYDSLNGSMRELQSSVKEFREDPRKFLRLKVF